MDEMIRRVVRSEIKSVNEKDYTVDVTMSDETIDRYKEIIKASAWKKRMASFKAHPILLSSHNYHGLMNQIGESLKIGVKDEKLASTFKYYAGEGNPEADWAWVLASKGVAAYSVGFIRHAGYRVDPDADYEEDEEKVGYQKAGVRYVYTDVELLECSHVTVPANPMCLQNSFDQGVVMRDLEERAFPMMAELEIALKNLSRKVKDVEKEAIVNLPPFHYKLDDDVKHSTIQDISGSFFEIKHLVTTKEGVFFEEERISDEHVFHIIDLKGMTKEDWITAYASEVPHWAEGLSPSVFAQKFSDRMKKDGVGSRVLEVGCGNGRDSIFFAKSGFTTTGIDIAPGAINLAKKNAKKLGVNVTFLEADVESLPFEDKSFDSVFSLSVLHSTDFGKSFSEVQRVLKEKGLLFVHLYTNTIKADGIEEKHISVDQFIDLWKEKGFEFLSFYDVCDDLGYDEFGEKHDMIVGVMRKA